MAADRGSQNGNARVLCLDEGGLRCLSQIHILKRLMHHVVERETGENNPSNVPEPYQYFDLICGTGMGGILALFLGRLHLGLEFSEEWIVSFYKQMPSSIWLPVGDLVLRKSAYLLQKLERAFEAAGEPVDITLDGGSLERECRVFVLAMLCDEMLVPVRLRSYSSRSDDAIRGCTVMQAAQAVVSFPNEFPSVRLGHANLPHTSAITAYANPAGEALDEAGRIWQIDSIDCLVSLGAGIPAVLSIDPGPWTGSALGSALTTVGLGSLPNMLAHTRLLAQNAVDCERCHDLVDKMTRLQRIGYFRFNVSHGLEAIRHNISDEGSAGKIHQKTNKYLDSQETQALLDVCSMSLCKSIASALYTQKRLMEPKIAGVRRESSEVVSLVQEGSAGARGLLQPEGITTTRLSSLPALLDEPKIRQEQNSLGSDIAADQWLDNLHMVRTVLERRGKEDDEKVKIAILDSGIDPALKAAVDENMATKDWTASPHRADDLLGHGTYAAGIIGQLAPKAQLFIEKVFESFEGDAQTTNRIARAIHHAVTVWNVNIISMSFAFRDRDVEVEAAINTAHSKGVIMLAAASNSGKNEGLRPAYPADYGHVFKIYSSNGNGTKSDWSPDPNPRDDNFSVLGEAVRFGWPEQTGRGFSERKSGTSLATPVAASIAALVLEYASQEPCSIGNKDSLWHYHGMRTIFTVMSKDDCFTGTYHYLRPWAIFNPQWSNSEISNIIQVELSKQGFAIRSEE